MSMPCMGRPITNNYASAVDQPWKIPPTSPHTIPYTGLQVGIQLVMLQIIRSMAYMDAK